MPAAYDLMRQRCGLSQSDAAEFHEVRLDTIKSWCSGRRPAPASAVDELRELYGNIVAAGLEYAGNIEARPPQLDEGGNSFYYVGEPIDDREARTHGWPNAAACMAAVGVAIAALPRGVAIKLAPHPPGVTGIPRAKPERTRASAASQDSARSR